MRILLLSAYAASSHRHWAESLQEMFADWDWQLLSLPARHFSWRIRGNPLYWALQERDVLQQPYDCLLATSMVDLATLRGLVPQLSHLPTALYFHENQFAYPQQERQHSLVEAQMLSLYSALAADRVLFNSQYNRDSFLEGSRALLDKLPDYVPPGVESLLREKSDILPVPYDVRESEPSSTLWPGKSRSKVAAPLRLIWLGRFEYDKGPERLLAILQQLEQSQTDYEVALVGQQFRNSPAVFEEIEKAFSHRLVHVGYVEKVADYQALLRQSDVVLSTALHEFQGLSIMQAVAAGCLPLVPRRLVYPEVFDPCFCYESHLDDPQREAESAVATLLSLWQKLGEGALRAPGMEAFSRGRLRPAYRACIQGLAQHQDSH